MVKISFLRFQTQIAQIGMINLLLQIDAEIKLGSKHKLCVTYWDNTSHTYEEINSDQKLLHAIDHLQCYPN